MLDLSYMIPGYDRKKYKSNKSILWSIRDANSRRAYVVYHLIKQAERDEDYDTMQKGLQMLVERMLKLTWSLLD
jgi:hypothetical protein